jgi:hypothetical protein
MVQAAYAETASVDARRNLTPAGSGPVSLAAPAPILGNQAMLRLQRQADDAVAADSSTGSVSSAAGASGPVATPTAAGSRPVFFCSKPILLSFLHGKRHAFFRIGGSGTGNETYELEHDEPCSGCYVGYPRHNEPEDRDATDALCTPAPAISDSALASNWNAYPIGQYCAWGPNSNTYARVIAEKCGGKGLRPPGDVPGFDDTPPMPGTFGPPPIPISAAGLCYEPGGCHISCLEPEPDKPTEPSPV